MRQILHIFLKDTRRFWLEIAISLALVAAFAWFYPLQWVGPDHLHRMLGGPGVVPYTYQYLGAILLGLVPVSWWLMISRVVHAETLPGDRQFWLTRPYEWKSLLGAKLLFLLAYVYLPLLAAQCALLAEAGFNPAAYFGGLLHNLILITAIIVLPIFALATVTSNFARMTLMTLGILVGFIALGYVAALLVPANHAISIASPYDGAWAALALLLGVCTAAVALEYAQRKTWLARVALFGVPVLLIIAGPLVVHIAQERTLVDHAYPRQSGDGGAPVQLTYHLLTPGTEEVESYTDGRVVIMHIPVRGTGVAEGYVVVPDLLKVAINAPDGSHWVSDWQDASAPKLLPGEQFGDAVVSMPRTVYDQFKGKPLAVNLTLALSEAKVGRVTQIPLPTGDFSIPGFGVCSPQRRGLMGLMSEVTAVLCRSALREPPFTYINVVWSDARCSAKHGATDAGVQGAGWAGALDRAPAQFGLASVWNVSFSLSNNFKDPRMSEPRYLCPGSPLTFTQYDLGRRTQTNVTFHDYHLPTVTIYDGQVHAVTSR